MMRSLKLAGLLGSALMMAACQFVSQDPAEVVASPPVPITTPVALTRASPFVSEMYNFLVKDEVLSPGSCVTVFTGSSSIRFWFTLDKDFPALEAFNRGFGGSRLQHATDYFDILITPHRPREIVLYSGENDISNGASASDVLASLKAFLAKKTETIGDTPVYFISIKPSIARFGEFETQTAANDSISAYAGERADLVFIDIVPSMMEAGVPKDLFISDTLHMNADGYAIWTKIVGRALANPNRPRAAHCQ